MFEDMDEIEAILYMELRFGPLCKSIPGGWGIDKVDVLDKELVTLLQKYKSEKGIRNPIPRIRSWVSENKLNFLFFDKETGKRILLGEWLSGRERKYEH